MSKKLFYALPTLLTAVAMLAANELAANNPPAATDSGNGKNRL